ncbi:cobyric acid synthase [Thalassotalea sp. PS06]|uniref:cobyric acid synthase n=1 Tax=Thalassotalea sp. PS06 TaxID=2594005 RepID=UPI001162466E|nr:cobyric acid synthase [Thalassotalea sp. PS06]QDP00906.1 cobyric acid synthase [Thalassotalea sp. PS06]
MINCKNNIAPTLMIQGTTSDAGKSTLVAALARVWQRRGLHVAPMKPQNMALNAAVTPCGGEVGRAQAIQAQAAKVDLNVHFNPILLKPNSDTGAQVIVHGKALTIMQAAQYQDYKKAAMNAVLESHQYLQQEYQRIVVEGAGSPAEINLREGDIANMGFAEATDCPVILIADIDKGGVFAHLVGTLELLSESEQNRVVGFVINRFRGDIKLLESGLDWLEEKTGKPVLGVLPYLHGLTLSEEDAVNSQVASNNGNYQRLKVIVPVLPSMSNHDDFDPLRWHQDIDFKFIYTNPDNPKPLPAADLIILPGSKSVAADLQFLRSQGWDKSILRHLRYGGKVIGVCAGMQMLGQEINDPLGVESTEIKAIGLGLLPISTTLSMEKTLTNVEFQLNPSLQNAKVKGYEIHAGQSQLISRTQSKALYKDAPMELGFISDDGKVMATYVHGFFNEPEVLQAISRWCGHNIAQSDSAWEQQEKAIDRLADACEQDLNLNLIEDILTKWYQDDK